MQDARLWPLFAFGAVAAFAGLLPLVWLFKRLGRAVARRAQPPRSATLYLLALFNALALFLLSFATLSLWVTLSSWRGFTRKTHVAEVQCIELAPQRLRVYLVPIEPDGVRGATEIYDVDGDQWQLGGDVLRFRPLLNALGVTTFFRLTRVEGRWTSAADANAHRGSAHDRLQPSGLWNRLYRDSDRAPLRWLLAGAHGQSVSQLPDRRAVFDLYVTPTGYILDKRSL